MLSKNRSGLSKRYQRLVASRLRRIRPSVPDQVSRFARTQVAWHFYANPSVTLAVLKAPLTEDASAV